MTALYIAGAVVLLIFILLMTRGGATAEYSEDGFFLTARFGFIRLHILPAKEKTEEQKRKAAHKKAEKKAKKSKAESEKSEKPKKGGLLKKLKLYLPPALEFLNGFRKKLRIDELTVWYVSAGEDPAAAALMFGRVSAAMGVLTGALERVLDIKKRDFRAAVSFDDPEPRVYLKAEASIRVGQLLWLAARFGIYILKHRTNDTDNKGKVDKNG